MRRSRPSGADAEGAGVNEAACTRVALELLARREHSRRELARKLAARGFPSDVVSAVLDQLERTGALADARFTDSFVRSRIGKGQGPQRIRAELAQRGITVVAWYLAPYTDRAYETRWQRWTLTRRPFES